MILITMSKPQLAVRIPPELLKELNSYIEKTHTSKTDVVVSVIAQYLGCPENVPLTQRMAELELKVAELESKARGN